MKRLKITHVVYSYLPVTQNWIYTQLLCNTSCDHSIVSLTEEKPTQFPWNERFVAFTGKKITDIFRLFLARYWIKQPDRFFYESFRILQPDIIHGHFSTESWRVLSNAKKTAVPLVTTFYGLDVDKLSRRNYWKKRYPELFRYGSAFVVEGPFMGERLKAIGCPEEKIHVIALGVDPAGYCSHPVNGSKSEETITVLFVGLNREKKGAFDAARTFIAAAGKNSRIHFSVVGDGAYRSGFEAMIRTAGLSHRVKFYGYCGFDAYREILASADIVLVPSHCARDGDSEGGAPVVCIEAQMAGIPVVGTRHCDIPFIVHHNESGLLSAEHDVAGMSRDVLLLADDRIKRMQMGIEGRRYALLQHDISRQADALTKLYWSVAGKRS